MDIQYQTKGVKMNISYITDIALCVPDKEELTFGRSATFTSEIKTIIDTQRVKYVIIDMSEINNVDSSTVGSFISIFTILRKGGGNLIVAEPSKEIIQAMQMLKVKSLISTAKSVDVAIKSLTKDNVCALCTG